MFKTTQYCELKSIIETIKVPSGTLVTPIKKNGNNETMFAIIDSDVLEQQNQHDRKYRYLFVPSDIVEEIK
jgi:hypothetical protein